MKTEKWIWWTLFLILCLLVLIIFIFLSSFYFSKRAYSLVLHMTGDLCREWRNLIQSTALPTFKPALPSLKTGQLSATFSPLSSASWELMSKCFFMTGYLTDLSCVGVNDAKHYLNKVDHFRAHQLLMVDGTMFGVVGEIENTSVVFFVGSATTQSWLDDLEVAQETVTLGPGPPVKIHRGFFQLTSSVQSQISNTLEELGHSQVLFVGHSLGAAMATLSSLFWSFQAPSSSFFMVMTAGCPRVGNNDFASLCARMVPHRWQLVNQADVVPDLPPPVTPQVDISWEKWAGFFPVPRLTTKNYYYTHVSGGEISFRTNLDSLKKNHVVAYRDFIVSHVLQ